MRFTRRQRHSWLARGLMVALLYLLVGPSLDLDFDGSLVRAWFGEQAVAVATEDTDRALLSPWLPAAPAGPIPLSGQFVLPRPVAAQPRLSHRPRQGHLRSRAAVGLPATRADAPADPA